MVAISGLEPELFALRGRRVNQLHHIATERMKHPLQLREYNKNEGEITLRGIQDGTQSIPANQNEGVEAVLKLDSKLLHFVVVVLAVEDVPLLRAFEDDLALRADLEACSLIDL